MAYLDNVSPRERATSIGTVVLVHAALGYALVVGLQATGVIAEDTNIKTIFIPESKPKPPPPPQPVDDPQPTQQQSQIYTPPITPLTPIDSGVTTTVILPPPTDYVIPTSTPTSIPEVPGGLITPVRDPIAAKPRGRPGTWITENDYRSSWINRELTGIAGFRLGVGANGQVTSCEITRSTGHAELDAATCSLLQRRARFEAARDGNGERTTGTFTSSVEWRIPN